MQFDLAARSLVQSPVSGFGRDAWIVQHLEPTEESLLLRSDLHMVVRGR